MSTDKLDLTGHIALVTGGSRGIGRASSLLMASRGADIAVNYHTRRDAADEVVAAITAMGRRAYAVQADVAEAAQVEAMMKDVIDNLGTPDILIANAGATADDLVVRMSEETWDHVINTNLRGTYLTTRAALRGMMRARWGRIIAISSVAGIRGSAGQSNYAAAKAGVIMFIRSVAKEMGSRNITANTIAPGVTETEMTAHLTPDVKQHYLEELLLGRWGTPDDVAEMVAFFASDAASYITGQTIAVDGGLSA
ncbi:MAG: 3-oxoacyl-[acyl-carrier-protein] reductase [Dehalococcoidia bacterium]|nr:3-oxoacyl-[acyl-carrier-protein] reductase [Dehalococcoidia bacterium]